MGQQTAAIYTRVSTDDQDCERQVNDLKAFAERAGYTVIHVFTETASGAKNNRAIRAQVLELAQARKINAILVTELTRWGRSTEDLLSTLQQLAAWNVSVVAEHGWQFDLNTPEGKLMITVLAGIAEFERGLLQQRVKSGIAAAKAKGVKFGRPEGFNPSDKIAPKVLKMIEEGLSSRVIAHHLGISKNTVTAIKARNS